MQAENFQACLLIYCTVSFPVDCEWGEYSQCNASCGPGTQIRMIKIQAQFGGKICNPDNSTKKCFIKECLKPGK